ncbi:hypothetical protein SCA6_010885 [Theobroma cacao]
MAISSSPDWSLASTDSYTSKTRKFGRFSSCKTLHFVSFPTSNLPLFHIYSSGCPSPILEDASTNVPSTKLELKFQGSQQFSLPDLDNLNSFLCGLLQDTQNERLAYDYYEKAKRRPGFIPEKPMLQLLIRMRNLIAR